VVRHFNGRALSEKHTIGTVGGTVPGIPVGQSSPQGEWTTESVQWQADHLIVRTTRSPQPPDEPGRRSEHEEVWSLDRDGRLLITLSDRRSGFAPITVHLVYERRPLGTHLARAAEMLRETRCGEMMQERRLHRTTRMIITQRRGLRTQTGPELDGDAARGSARASPMRSR
jgi:hypothetical protein